MSLALWKTRETVHYLYVPKVAMVGNLASFIECEPRDDWQFQMKRRRGPEGDVWVVPNHGDMEDDDENR